MYIWLRMRIIERRICIVGAYLFEGQYTLCNPTYLVGDLHIQVQPTQIVLAVYPSSPVRLLFKNTVIVYII